MTEHIYAHEHPESDRTRGGGFTLWFTGLSGSGKTTIAHLVGPELDRRGCLVEYLDGDTVRTHLSKGLGFSKEDRDAHIERVGWVASRLTRHGAAGVAPAISPYEATRPNERVLEEMRLASGLPWAMPVCLAVEAPPAGDRVALADGAGRLVAVLDVEDV